MSLPSAIACVLALAALLGGARLLWSLRGTAPRPRGWRLACLLLAQAAGAGLLWLALFPPAVRVAAGTLTLFTAGASQVASPPVRGIALALPEASARDARGAVRVPDLATALRRHPQATHLQVIGGGLPARDRDAVAGRALAFFPAPLPRGLVELRLPARVAAGRAFRIAGTASGLDGGSAELLDPSGRRGARAAIGASGAFVLDASTRAAGPARWLVRLRDARGAAAGDTPFALDVQPARVLRAVALAGAPNAELKFLRRWALDAGIALDARIDLGGGVRIGAAATDAAALRRADLLLVDLRSWSALGASGRAAVLSAVDGGLGLLVRATAADGADPRALRALGFASTPGAARAVRLGAGFVRAGDAVDALPTLTATVRGLSADDGVVALADAAGTPLAAWRARGRGRVGIAAFDGSYRLALAGRGDAHSETWSRLFAALARPLPQAADPPAIRAGAPGERSVLCGIGTPAFVTAPDGRRTALRVDPRTGAARCAGYWADAPGWQVLSNGGRDTPFLLAAHPGIDARERRDATRALATDRASAGLAATTAPGPRWPWFLAWLLFTAATWWLERSRAGLRPIVAG